MREQSPGGSLQKYTERIHRALDFINEHLAEEIRLADVAEAACFSPFHFHRIFSGFMGETPDDYIRRLRLEKAAGLMHVDRRASVTDVALQCGFSTQALFSRHFKRRFGLSPTEWKAGKNRHADSKNDNALPRRSPYTHEYKGELEVEVERRQAFPIAFVRHLRGYTSGAGDAFRKLFAWAKPRGLMGPDAKVISISLDNPGVTPGDKCRLYACVSLAAPVPVTGEVSLMEIPAGTYAKVPFSGDSKTIGGFYRKFFRDWLPASGFCADDFPIYHVMPLPQPASRLSARFDAYIKLTSL